MWQGCGKVKPTYSAALEFYALRISPPNISRHATSSGPRVGAGVFVAREGEGRSSPPGGSEHSPGAAPVAAQVADRIAGLELAFREKVREFLLSALSREDPEIAESLLEELFSGAISCLDIVEDCQIARGEALLAQAPGHGANTVAFAQKSELLALRMICRDASQPSGYALVRWLLSLQGDGEPLPGVFIGSEEQATLFANTPIFRNGYVAIQSLVEDAMARIAAQPGGMTAFLGEALERLQADFPKTLVEALQSVLQTLLNGLSEQGAAIMLCAIEQHQGYRARFDDLVALQAAKKQFDPLVADAEHVIYYAPAERNTAFLDYVIHTEHTAGNPAQNLYLLKASTALGDVFGLVKTARKFEGELSKYPSIELAQKGA